MGIFRKIRRVIPVLGAAMLLQISTIYSQDTNFENFLGAGAEDASRLTKEYMEPLVMGFSYGMSGSWYNTAKTHQLLGFDFTVSTSLTSVPASREYFIFRQSEYNNVSSSGDSPLIPTIYGPSEGNENQLRFDYFDEASGQTITGSYSPTGLGIKEQYGFNMVPVPIMQLGIGTFINTDIIIRYTPELKFGDFKTCVFGLGIKHDIKQWFPSLHESPTELAIMAGISGFENSMDLSEDDPKGLNQETVFNVNNWTVQAIASRRVSIITVYGALGLSKVTSSLSMNGIYIVEDQQDPQKHFRLIDPVQINYRGISYRATAGAKLHLGKFAINTDYTWQEYPVVSVGMGFGIN